MIGTSCGRSFVDFDQRRDRRIDVRAIRRHFRRARPRDHPALRARMPRPCRDVIGIEQIGEALVERPIARRKPAQQKLFEEPRDMGAMPFGRARIRHRLDHLVFGRQQRGAPLGFRPHRPKGIEPIRPRIAGRRFGRAGFHQSVVFGANPVSEHAWMRQSVASQNPARRRDQ